MVEVTTPVPGQTPGVGFLGTSLPLAAAHDVALLDLDGVVYVGPDAVAHAADSLDAAREQHAMRAGFVTNNAARPPAVVAEHLRSLGIRAADTDVVTSAQAGARVLAQLLAPGSRVLAVGGPGVPWALQERGLVPVQSADDDPVAVMQGYGPDVTWRDLAEASLVIGRGGMFVATNLDSTIPSPRGRVLGNGAMVAALRHATGVEPIVAGKPEPPLMIESVERTRAARPLVVGDRLDTDIEGATRAGIPALLVLTGVTDWQDVLAAAPQHRPSYLSEDLRGLLEPAPVVLVDRADGIVTAACRGVRARATARPAELGDPAVADLSPWLPEPMRERSPESVRRIGLDAVRAVLALSWALRDARWLPSRVVELDSR